MLSPCFWRTPHFQLRLNDRGRFVSVTGLERTNQLPETLCSLQYLHRRTFRDRSSLATCIFNYGFERKLFCSRFSPVFPIFPCRFPHLMTHGAVCLQTAPIESRRLVKLYKTNLSLPPSPSFIPIPCKRATAKINTHSFNLCSFRQHISGRRF